MVRIENAAKRKFSANHVRAIELCLGVGLSDGRYLMNGDPKQINNEWTKRNVAMGWVIKRIWQWRIQSKDLGWGPMISKR